MIVSREPREHSSYSMTVSGGGAGTGSKAVNLSGYLDGVICDAPGSETYKFIVTGPSGKTYYVSPADLTGDTTVLFNPPIPMTGAMTIGISNASAGGTFTIIPIGDLKKV